MKDGISLIGKTISVKSVEYVIQTMYFVPGAINKESYLYFGLEAPNGIMVNYSYYDLLPYIREQIIL
jgi:hypothetical protein